ncbi:MAG TPA: hypothetical protein PK293_17110 [Spirochaetota bacterium]|jgi:hypothetical protein|nr:hypothetical protein [Spirochaetota bacterium]
MRPFFKIIFRAVPAALVIISLFLTPGSSAGKKAAPLGKKDLRIFYKSKTPLTLFGTPYKKFTRLAGNTGRWEDEEKFRYTWDEGQAGFLKTEKMKAPQLVMITLSENFKTARGIKKGSTLDELLKAYPDEYSTTEGGNGLWYDYRWTAKSRSPKEEDKNFRISFFVENGNVDSVMLRLESEEADEIPVG